MGTKRNPGKFDCYERADPDEPLFVLLGRDPVGASLVYLWADARERLNPGDPKIKEALECAVSMAWWCSFAKGKPVDVLSLIPIETLEAEIQRRKQNETAIQPQEKQETIEVFGMTLPVIADIPFGYKLCLHERGPLIATENSLHSLSVTAGEPGEDDMPVLPYVTRRAALNAYVEWSWSKLREAVISRPREQAFPQTPQESFGENTDARNFRRR